MRLSKMFIGFGLAVSMTLSIGFSSFAGVLESGVVSSYNGRYAFNVDKTNNLAQNYCQAEKVLNSACPAVGMTTMDNVYSSGDGSVMIDDQNLNKLDSIQNQTDEWLAANMAAIVPQGTPSDQIVTICADWVADRMTYDYSSNSNKVLGRAYQSALSCFTLGTGLCSTYAYAFNSMVSYVPVNPATGTVDYTAANPSHIRTRFVYTSRHAWSAVFENGAWHHYDVCSYDIVNRDKRYLDMDSSVMSDSKYLNISIVF
ncbi:MAG: transglutaminase-like domain-containing protein [Bacillota bacterium]|uniref:Transglutaminase-like superfamily protein n=1 Tax=[Clostridium] aminophilum TaxID=1526 RepID=A0A1I6IEV2_9FIRM|nr:transglutaminase-like domain-containing protein [[Clostridium] aminophilum]MCR4629399.1 transglutaminase-like domain-containing protein [Clostridium sp.]MDT3844183.1 transglutaminase-like domain-containing protein [Bacillota bacterium]SFR65307.1 Transglutaminase-like superfamily protein [[Clostridium] aminophilum]